jgi:ADP-ribose pyrophosphatase YjhB (NUDIX family)
MLQPDDAARDLERQWVERVGASRRIRAAARALVIRDEHILLQRLDYSDAHWFFPGGAVEFGETLEDAVRRELAEETTLAIERVVYRLTANNRFERDGATFHLIEHFFEVLPATFEVESREESVLLEWYPLGRIGALDLRPTGVRNMLAIDGWREVRLLEVE